MRLKEREREITIEHRKWALRFDCSTIQHIPQQRCYTSYSLPSILTSSFFSLSLSHLLSLFSVFLFLVFFVFLFFFLFSFTFSSFSFSFSSYFSFCFSFRVTVRQSGQTVDGHHGQAVRPVYLHPVPPGEVQCIVQSVVSDLACKRLGGRGQRIE